MKCWLMHIGLLLRNIYILTGKIVCLFTLFLDSRCLVQICDVMVDIDDSIFSKEIIKQRFYRSWCLITIRWTTTYRPRQIFCLFFPLCLKICMKTDTMDLILKIKLKIKTKAFTNPILVTPLSKTNQMHYTKAGWGVLRGEF